MIDGAVGYTGGFGFDDKWLGGGRRPGEWRETNARFTWPAVIQLQASFIAKWAEAARELLTGGAFFPVASPPGPGAEARDAAHRSVDVRKLTNEERSDVQRPWLAARRSRERAPRLRAPELLRSSRKDATRPPDRPPRPAHCGARPRHAPRAHSAWNGSTGGVIQRPTIGTNSQSRITRRPRSAVARPTPLAADAVGPAFPRSGVTSVR